MTIFNLKEYREIITALINNESGIKLRLSKHVGCQPAYLSRVMSYKADLSQDQILLAADFFKLDKEQTEYLVYTLLENRSGNLKSKSFFREKADQIAQKGLRLKRQLKAETQLPTEFEGIYYSSWLCGALHISLLNPKADLKDFAEQCGLRWADILTALNKLEKIGLITKSNGRWIVTKTNTHLGSDSPWLSRHHINWRMKTTEKLSREDLDGLHYTSVASCSHEDRKRIHQIMVEAVQNCRNIIKNSSDEVSFHYACDVYDLVKST